VLHGPDVRSTSTMVPLGTEMVARLFSIVTKT
jgi:hypothetical protein